MFKNLKLKNCNIKAKNYIKKIYLVIKIFINVLFKYMVEIYK